MIPIRPMVGHLLVAVIFVDGPPGSSAAFSDAEKIDALRAVYGGVGLLRQLSERWGAQQPVPVDRICGFTVTHRSITLKTRPEPLAAAPKEEFDLRDKIWLEEATASLGFPTGTLREREEALRAGLQALTFFGLRSADAVPVIITKYPCHHSAYAADSVMPVVCWPDVVREEPRTTKEVVAHELGHAFGAPDEYAGNDKDGDPHCLTTNLAGPFDQPNTNCATIIPATEGVPAVLNPAQVPCLMNHNSPTVCPATPGFWGWTDDDRDGIVDLGAPAAIRLGERATSPGSVFAIEGRNVWDARAVAFGSHPVTSAIDVVDVGRIHVIVPPDAGDGIVNVSLVTRAGPAHAPFQDTWVLVTGRHAPPPRPPTGPVVFGITPARGRPGTVVQILGPSFAPPTAVTFDGVPADLTNVDPFFLSFGLIEVPAPPHAPGEVPVVVTTADGDSPPFPPFTQFTYL